MYAIRDNDLDLVRYLMSFKELDKSSRDSRGMSYIHYVVMPLQFGSYENVKLLELLHENHFDLNIEDE
jgi:hypothetical protein